MIAFMDLQGIGAVASAAVALIGIPAAVLVGRGQTKAAVRAAQLTADAGHVQAEATYSAALHAVRDQARAEHRQWRHTLRREAWAQFTSAVNDVRTAADDLAHNTGPNHEHARLDEASVTAERALAFTVSVVDLEGPPAIAEAADRAHRMCQALLRHTRQAAPPLRADALLQAIETGNQSIDMDDATSARDALHELGAAVHARDTGSSYPIQEAGQRATAAAQASARSLTVLATCGVTGAQATALIRDAQQRITAQHRRQSVHAAQDAVMRMMEVFTEAARTYLDTDVPDRTGEQATAPLNTRTPSP